MAKYRDELPQLSNKLFLTDGGLETTLIFHQGLELPEFAAFDLLKDEAGRNALTDYYCTYAAIAKKYGAGFVLESATWRANPDWATLLGYSQPELDEVNRQSIAMLEEIRGEFEDEQSPMVISGCVGPRGDGYNPSGMMSADEAAAYHSPQIRCFRDAGADMVAAITMNYIEEAAGIAQAAKEHGMPAAISFTVETDGKLPTGHTLRQAIVAVDELTSSAPAYYMINCAHPEHFRDVLEAGQPWVGRIRGLRANASTKSHAELNESEELDAGDPVKLGQQHRELLQLMPNVTVLGGCCGTDHRHVEEMYRAVVGVG